MNIFKHLFETFFEQIVFGNDGDATPDLFLFWLRLRRNKQLKFFFASLRLCGLRVNSAQIKKCALVRQKQLVSRVIGFFPIGIRQMIHVTFQFLAIFLGNLHTDQYSAECGTVVSIVK